MNRKRQKSTCTTSDHWKTPNGCFSGYWSFNVDDVYNNDARIGNYVLSDWFGAQGVHLHFCKRMLVQNQIYYYYYYFGGKFYQNFRKSPKETLKIFIKERRHLNT
jgi:hypothetical protein